MTNEVVQLTAEQLSVLIQTAVQSALASAKPKARQPKAEADPAKAAKQEAYLQSKKEVALRKAKETGFHYHVCRKAGKRQLLVWGDQTRDSYRRQGMNPDIQLGKVVWSTSMVDGFSPAMEAANA
jgi:hypothetical protein